MSAENSLHWWKVDEEETLLQLESLVLPQGRAPEKKNASELAVTDYAFFFF